jgi:hypothetical protein
MRPENEVVKACLRLLALKGIFSWRQNTAGLLNPKTGKYYFHGLRGVPDILAIAKGGRFLGIECKSAEGRQTPDQKMFEAQCVKAGGIYLLVHSAGELADKLEAP